MSEPDLPQDPIPATGRAEEPDEAPKSGRISRSLQLRLFSAAVIIPFVIFMIFIGGLPFLVTLVAIICLGLREFYEIIEAKGLRPQKTAGIVGGALLGIVAYVGNEYQTNVLLTAVLLVVMILQLLKQDIAEAISDISATFFGVFYVGWLMSHAILLRRMDEILRIKYGAPAEGPFWMGGAFVDDKLGIFLLLFCIVTVAGTDVGAYFVGRRFGRLKLAPRVSPNKTVEGAVGGALVGILLGLVAWAVFNFWILTSPVLPLQQAVLIAALLSVFGILGDLAESLIKRDAKAKDTGTIFPGMGGMLDRIDSNMVAFPVLYYYMSAWFFFRSFVSG
ncbi:MAG: CDP-archaeol synthase [Deltaproteobacteria bacterium]|nr:CDP-archaeol synthase [Deltaproteobacteria bacterium]